MNCPGCTLEMTATTFPALYAPSVELDACPHCNGLWFDGKESLQLTPGAVIELFRTMYARVSVAKQPLVAQKHCPRCEGELVETQDLVRTTRFSYFRCDDHGRFITFFQFLREKNLVRAPNPKELADLKARVKIVQCSNCGAPIELASGSTCSHCQAPVSILSAESIGKTLKELGAKETRRTTVDPTLAARLVMDQLRTDKFYRDNEIEPQPSTHVVLDLVASGAKLLLDALL